MARADLVLGLVRAWSQNDETLFTHTVEALASEERARQHHVLADQLLSTLHRPDALQGTGRRQPDATTRQLFHEVSPRRTLNDLILPPVVASACQGLIEEHRRAELLRSYNLEPRNRILLSGPPGNGKTSLAEAIAEGLIYPLLIVRYESIIGSFLGETATRLSSLFEHVRGRQCVLFFDEFDAIAKERGDVHETGEVKRVVSSLLLQIDALPSYVVVVVASNHPELLDSAVWRRFQIRLQLPQPGQKQLAVWFERFKERFGRSLGYSTTTLAQKLSGVSFAEAEEFATDIQRRYVLSLPQGDLKSIVSSCLQQWQARNRVLKDDGEYKDDARPATAHFSRADDCSARQERRSRPEHASTASGTANSSTDTTV